MNFVIDIFYTRIELNRRNSTLTCRVYTGDFSVNSQQISHSHHQLPCIEALAIEPYTYPPSNQSK